MIAPACIRDAAKRDLDAIAAIHVAGWRSAFAGLVPQSYLDTLSVAARRRIWAERLASPDTRFKIQVAVTEGAVHGFVAVRLTPGSPLAIPGELSHIFVSAERIGRGLGRMLFDAGAARLAALGADRFHLWVLAGNSRALGFYRGMGAVPVPGAVRTDRIDGQDVTEIALWRASIIEPAGQ